jgi:hypothetical protein
VIFDNADDMDMWIKSSNAIPALKDCLPQSEQGHILFTTRNQKLVVKLAFSNVISIPELDEETARKVLEKSLIRKELLDDNNSTTALLKPVDLSPAGHHSGSSIY